MRAIITRSLRRTTRRQRPDRARSRTRRWRRSSSGSAVPVPSGTRRGRWRSSPSDHASFTDGLADAGFVLGGPLAHEHRVVYFVEAESEDAIRTTLADDPWSRRLPATCERLPCALLRGPPSLRRRDRWFVGNCSSAVVGSMALRHSICGKPLKRTSIASTSFSHERTQLIRLRSIPSSRSSLTDQGGP